MKKLILALSIIYTNALFSSGYDWENYDRFFKKFFPNINMEQIEYADLESEILTSNIDFGDGSNRSHIHGGTLLHFLCAYCFIDSIKQLTERLLKNPAFKIDINIVDAYGNTPLHLAVENNAITISSLLIQRGADITIKNSQGQTALDIVEEMLQIRNYLSEFRTAIFPACSAHHKGRIIGEMEQNKSRVTYYTILKKIITEARNDTLHVKRSRSH